MGSESWGPLWVGETLTNARALGLDDFVCVLVEPSSSMISGEVVHTIPLFHFAREDGDTGDDVLCVSLIEEPAQSLGFGSKGVVGDAGAACYPLSLRSIGGLIRTVEDSPLEVRLDLRTADCGYVGGLEVAGPILRAGAAGYGAEHITHGATEALMKILYGELAGGETQQAS